MVRYVFFQLNRQFFSSKLTIYIFFSFIFICKPVLAVDLPDTFQLHGFASQTFILTNENNFFGRSSKEGSFEFTELGLNSSIRPYTNLQLSVQIVSRRAGEGDNGNVRLDYAFADYTVISNRINRGGIRAGRIKNPFGLYNETRDVAFTRPSILLPQSIYFDRTRNLGLSSDAFLLYEEYRGIGGNMVMEIGAGMPKVDDLSTEFVFFSKDQAGSLHGKTSYAGRIMYGWNGDRVRIAVSSFQLNISYDAAQNDILKGGRIQFEPLIFSGQYNAELWSLTFEYSLRFVHYKDFGPSLPDDSSVGESYYLQAAYRIFKKWEMLVRYDILFRDRDDRDGYKYAARTGKPNHSKFSKDLTFGLRWTALPSFLIGVEYHHVDGTGWLSLEDNPDILKTKRRWDMFLLMAAYRF